MKECLRCNPIKIKKTGTITHMERHLDNGCRAFTAFVAGVQFPNGHTLNVGLTSEQYTAVLRSMDTAKVEVTVEIIEK